MTDLFRVLEELIWPYVRKPARYIGSEFGITRKSPDQTRLRLALVYPDLYEVGMSNLGLSLLRRVANSVEGVAAERAFLPWPDMEALMRSHGVPLYSLETYTPLSAFDLVGITLQSELTYTNVLTVLDLAGIPLKAAGRSGHDPLVAAGGPCTINPEPMSPFFDFFVLGDGEEALREIVGVLLELKGGEHSRHSRLQALSRLEGIYVPGESSGQKQAGAAVKVRRVDELKAADAPDGLPVPLTEVAQHHYAVELMRGCTCGCRFCQAGMYYRPVRVRSPEEVIALVRRGMRAGGWSSATLLSLSSADYPGIDELVRRLLPEINGAGLSLSFPSLRVDVSTLRLLESLEGSKKSGLTFAVEAGSERLRKVIGKKVDEGELISLVEKAFHSDWTLVKLYFMVGLPTETDEDVDEIARVISRVASVGRSVPGRHNVNVTLSPFVPKPGTPFQWEAQEPPETVAGKLSRIRGKVRSRSVKLKVHDPWASLVEGLLARGDSAMAGVLETAWRLGARLDGWGERFDFSLWEKAFETRRLDWRSLLEKRAEDRQLPWHFVGIPVSEPFLAGQRDLAREGLVMPDCKDGSCLDCGAEKAPVCRKLRTPSARAPEIEAGPLSTGALPVATQDLERKLWRLQYAKHGLLRFCGHLDMVRNIEFLLRRSGVPVCYSAGYSPRMRLHFSAPLPLGLESRAEYFEVETLPGISEPELRQALERASSGLEGFAFLAVRPVPIGLLPPLTQDLCLCSYRALVELPGPAAVADPAEYLGQCRQRQLEEDATVAWTDPRGRSRTAEVGEALRSVAAGEPAGDRVSLTFELALQGPGACRPDRFLSWLLELENGKVASARIEKVRAYVRRGDFLKDPMEF